MRMPFISAVPNGVRVRVRLQPRASHDRIVGQHGDALKAQVTAAPVDGAANAALERLLARVAAVPASAVRVVVGAKSRDKVLEVITRDPAALISRLRGVAEPRGLVLVDKKLNGD
jgi:uncharacterized protein